jgi:hypothetical protein
MSSASAELLSQLKPCPLCGGTDIIMADPEELDDINAADNWDIECRLCACQVYEVGPGAYRKTVALWNSRPAEDELKAERDVLRAERQWQPIETAPKDGALLFGWRGYRIEMAWKAGAWHEWSDRDGDYYPVSDVTHWVPLPADLLPPQTLEGKP